MIVPATPAKGSCALLSLNPERPVGIDFDAIKKFFFKKL